MTTAPRFTNWAGALTSEGVALEAWMQARGIPLPDVPALAGSLLTRAARFYGTYPDEAARLWQQYLNDDEKAKEQTA